MAMQARNIDFNQLPLATRERFIRSTANQQLPQPILSDRLGTTGATVGWGFLFLCALGGLLLVVFADFGRVNGGGLQGPGWIAGYVTTTFLAFYSILALVRRRTLVKALPFQPGRYLFPMDFVDATSSVLKIIPMSSMTDFRGVHHHTNGVYTNTIFTFTFEGGHSENLVVNGKDAAEYALSNLRSVQGDVAAAVQARDVEKLYGLDVFFEARMHDWQPEPFGGSAGGPAAQALPALLQKAALVSLGVSLAIGPAVWLMRSIASDAAAFARIEKNANIWDIESYIRRGGRKAKGAKAELLPRAKLKEAARTPSVTSYRTVALEFPDHAVAKEARAEIAKLYTKTISTFNAQAAADPKMRAFMDRLFAHLQEKDTSKMVVRFAIPSATDLGAADAELSKKYPGGVAPIAGHFNEASSAPRETEIVRELQNAFKAIFPADMFALEQGPRLGKGADGASSPSIEIHYNVSPSGEVYEQVSNPNGKKFVGITVAFDVEMKIPGNADTFSFKLKVEPPERFSVNSTRYGTYTGDQDGRVYHAMATNAFVQLGTKLRAVFFRQDSAAFKGIDD
jgi:hypothetical protein